MVCKCCQSYYDDVKQGIRLLRTEAEIDKIDGGGDSGSEVAKDDVDEVDYEKPEKPVTTMINKGASKRKARSQKESSNGKLIIVNENGDTVITD